MIRLLMAATAAVTMAGCSSLLSNQSDEADVDHEYVAKVEQSARLGNAQVTWIARPVKRPTVTN